jgi:hypothetical protein
VVLVDGRVVAIWEQAREGDRLRVKVSKFGPILRAVEAGIHEEARELSRFLGLSDVTVRMEKS